MREEAAARFEGGVRWDLESQRSVERAGVDDAGAGGAVRVLRVVCKEVIEAGGEDVFRGGLRGGGDRDAGC